jgi:hypothetical protein
MATSPYDRDFAEPMTVPARRRAPVPVAAAVAALWAAILPYGLIFMLAMLGAAGQGGPDGIARLSAVGWLLGHGVPVQAPTDRISLIPLAITGLVAWRLVRAGIHASRATGGHRARSVRPALRAGACVAVAYAAVAAGVAVLAGSADLYVSPLRAALSGAFFAGLAATAGAVGHSRAGRVVLGRTPAALRDAVRVGIAAAALTVSAGAGVAGLCLAFRGADAANVLGSYRAGVLGQAGITMLCLAYLPNLAVWGAAYLIGPGFSVGVDTVVSPGEVLLGPVPGLPVLAGLPSGPLSGLGSALLAAPLVAGACAGWLVARRSRGARRAAGGWPEIVGTAALAGTVGGLLLQMMALMSGGGLGSGRLAQLGPDDWRIGLYATALVSLGAALGACIAPMLSRPPQP